MKQIKDTQLVEDLTGIIKGSKPEEAAALIVEKLRTFQDASGMKVCQNLSIEYKGKSPKLI